MNKMETMGKFLKRGISFCLIGCLAASSPILALADDNEVEVPNYMQPGSVIIYDDNLDYIFEQGGENVISNEKGSGVYASSGMKAVYDKNGLLRNVYYPVLGEPGSYKLSPDDPSVSLFNNSGVRKKGSGKYPYNDCVLNFQTDKVTGTGQITYYGQPDDPNETKFISDHNVNGKPYYLKLGDCATKWKVDDVHYGVKVKATNTKNNVSMTFIKNDCGTLPNAILDIFEDGTWSKKGICGLTVNNVKDSVDNGKISHPYE